MSTEKVPGYVTQKREMAARRLWNARTSIFAPNVRRQVLNGLHFTAMSAVAAITTNALNAWLADRGMTNRAFSIHVGDNPNRPNHQNPRRMKVM